MSTSSYDFACRTLQGNVRPRLDRPEADHSPSCRGPFPLPTLWDFTTYSGSAIHPHIELSSPHSFTGMTSRDKLNWWGANACNQVDTLALEALWEGVKNHEAYGSNGDNGHESLARAFAEQYDPAKAIEALFRATESELRFTVEQLIEEKRDDLDAAIDNEDEPTVSVPENLPLPLPEILAPGVI